MHESTLDRAKAQRPIVIEVAGEPLGVVVAHDAGFRFLAVKLPAFAIDGQFFPTVAQAQLAVSEAVRSGASAA